MNFLAVTVSNCCVISCRHWKSPILNNYNINGQELEHVDKVKDLSVLLDQRLTFKLHYAAVIDKANHQLGFILKLKNSTTRCVSVHCTVVWLDPC